MIRELRERKNISQRNLATILGVSNTAIYKIEKNVNTYFNMDLLQKIAKALDTTVEDIMKEVEQDEKTEKENKKQNDEPSAEEIESFLAGKKMLMFKGKLISETSLKGIYAFLQAVETELNEKEKKKNNWIFLFFYL